MRHNRVQAVGSAFDTKVLNTKATIQNLLDCNSVSDHQSPKTIVCSTKFGADSVVFLHLVTSIAPQMPIIWVDTGYNRRDTMAFVEDASDHLNLNLKIFKPKNHTIQIPPSLDDPEHGAFAETVKLAPFRQALKELGATHWISSVRQYQTPNRKTLPVTLKLSDQLTKVHPMLEWTEEDMLVYRSRHGLPAGPVAYDPTKGGSMGECGLHKVSSFF